MFALSVSVLGLSVSVLGLSVSVSHLSELASVTVSWVVVPPDRPDQESQIDQSEPPC
jgi:hypothetical protein